MGKWSQYHKINYRNGSIRILGTPKRLPEMSRLLNSWAGGAVREQAYECDESVSEGPPSRTDAVS